MAAKNEMKKWNTEKSNKKKKTKPNTKEIDLDLHNNFQKKNLRNEKQLNFI